MLHLLATLAIFVRCLLALTPTHLKPGALTDKLGEVFLIEEVLIVRYPYTSLINTTCTIKTVLDTLTKLSDSLIATTYREYKAPSDFHAQDVLQLLWQRIEYLKDKVERANTDYSLHPVHARTKRGLLNIVGSASKFLFGIATDDDVRDLRERYNRVFSFAAHNRRVINLNYKKIAILQSHLSTLLNHANKLTSLLNKALQRLDRLTGFLLIDQSLHEIETFIKSVSDVNEDIIINMIAEK